MSSIAEAIIGLADYPDHSPALIVQTPHADFVISPDGTGGGAGNRYVISRSQLTTLMREHGVGPAELTDPQALAKLAALVAAFQPRGSASAHDMTGPNEVF